MTVICVQISYNSTAGHKRLDQSRETTARVLSLGQSDPFNMQYTWLSDHFWALCMTDQANFEEEEEEEEEAEAEERYM